MAQPDRRTATRDAGPGSAERPKEPTPARASWRASLLIWAVLGLLAWAIVAALIYAVAAAAAGWS